MIEEGLDVDGIAHKIRLERQLSDTLFDFNEVSFKKAKTQSKRYWNEVDEYFGPTHPLKSKYRDLNSQATQLIIQQQQENSFYNQFANKEMLEERQDRFIDEILSIYRRNRKTDSVSNELID